MDTTRLEAMARDAAQAGDVMRAMKAYPANDSGNAERFVDDHPSMFRYVKAWKNWVIWNGDRWAVDDSGEVFRLAQAHARSLLIAAALIKDEDRRKRESLAALKLGDAPKLKAMLEVAQSDRRVVAEPKIFDADPFLLGVENGVVELKPGLFRKGKQGDNITKTAGTMYDAEATCPVWEQFLSEVLNGNAELVTYVQKAVGYTLSGATSEQCFFFLHGSGSNGKSTFTETVQALLGDYGQRAPQSLFTASPNGREPTSEMARLLGARLVLGSETEEGAKLAESRVKDLTGGDKITARNLYESWFDFTPVLKLWLFGNHRPGIRGTDNGIWRRVRYLPFEVQIPEGRKDPALPSKLRDELPGILNWAMKGFLLWQREGLVMPECLKKACEEYRQEEDLLGDFLADRTIDRAGGRVSRQELFDSYRRWSDSQNIKYTKQAKGFYKSLREHPKFVGKETKANGIRYFEGLVLADSQPALRLPAPPADFLAVAA